MCDVLVVVREDAVLFAKNSDREPGEAQVAEHRPRARPKDARLRVTHVEIDQAAETNEVVISRPTWMWGAEMGVNEHGLAIGNEAVFTRVPVETKALLGMDLVRLALERCASADEALELITWMIARHGQGGAAGYRNESFTYHNSFLIVDPRGAWLLETAGRFWAALRIDRGVRSTSNVLTIGADYTKLGPGTIEGARSLGFLRRGETFDFRACFGRPVMAWLAAGDVRRERVAACAAPHGERAVDLDDLARTLRDHAGKRPEEGARIVMPCAHASYWPTRGAGQTTASMTARLTRDREGIRVLMTGTSAPCLSVFKPMPLGGALVDTGPMPTASGYDSASLFWRAERLHRNVLRDYEPRRAAFEADRAALEARAAAATSAGAASDVWREHREAALGWASRAAAVPARRRSAFDAYWRLQSWRDGVPG